MSHFNLIEIRMKFFVGCYYVFPTTTTKKNGYKAVTERQVNAKAIKSKSNLPLRHFFIEDFFPFPELGLNNFSI